MKTVLVVEDTDDLRELFVEIIRDEGYQVEGAENGERALALLSTMGTQPCLVLLDMMMPVMDGRMFMAALGEVHSVASLPVVIVSAGVGEKDAQGARRFIKKPLSRLVLIDLVREFCGQP